MIHVFTSSAPNYVGKARALFASLRRHCPEALLHWLVVDRRRFDLESWVGTEVDKIWFAEEIGPGKDPTWRFGHGVVELATALKPYLAIELLSRQDTDLVVYLDPDIVVFSDLDDLLENALKAPVLLTPHLLKVEASRGAILDHELCMLRNGIFNLGFVAIRPCAVGERFVRWWAERCRLLCTEDSSSGAFTDQKWVDLAPLFFPEVRIERSARFNVATWNVNQRRLEGTFETGFTVDGKALGFYHFTGFDSGAHRLVVDHYARGNASVRMLVDWYGFRSRSLVPRTADLSWRLGRYPEGWEVLSRHRKIYRERGDVQEAFPDPLAETVGWTFTDWLRSAGEFGDPGWNRPRRGDAP